MHQRDSQAGSPSRTAALALFTFCTGWLLVVGILWLATGRIVPTVNVRWSSSSTREERAGLEQQFSLVLHESRGPDTKSYFAMDASPRNLGRIVTHPLVEDTAFINRGSFALEDPPTVRTWFGDRFRTRWLLASLYLSLFGSLTSVVVLAPRD